MKTTCITADGKEIELIKGKAYMIKHERSKQLVRRIFKGTEKRFDEIVCYVFTGKISKSASVDIEEVKGGKVFFWHWKGVKHPPCEISIPFYNLQQIATTD